MYDSYQPNRLLAQVPLTVSPFISLPKATTLPYTYKSVNTSLPPSLTVGPNGEKSKYVVSSTGHAAHPEEIIASCEALQAHLTKTQEQAKKAIQEWEDSIKERDLAEKRRIAPGWLDRSEKILEPTKAGAAASSIMDSSTEASADNVTPALAPTREGEEIDRVFGGLDIK